MSFRSSASSGMFKVANIKDVVDSMKDFKAEVKEKLVTQSSYRAAEVIRNDAQRRAPEDEGRLRHLIGRVTKRSKDGLTCTVKVGLLKISKTLNKQGITSDAYYGMFVELGTEFQKAQPFLRPAFDAQKEAYTVKMTDELRDLIEHARKRAARIR